MRTGSHDATASAHPDVARTAAEAYYTGLHALGREALRARATETMISQSVAAGARVKNVRDERRLTT